MPERFGRLIAPLVGPGKGVFHRAVFFDNPRVLFREIECLVEAGCGFVTVTNTGWDMHGTLKQTIPMLGSAVDKASAAFIEDLAERGLSDRVLFIITGEFGRTPKINNKSGRDHWGNLCTLALAGGGLNMGQVIGQSNRTASVPDGDPVTVRQLMGTVMNHLLNVGEFRILRGLPSEVAREASTAEPISQLG